MQTSGKSHGWRVASASILCRPRAGRFVLPASSSQLITASYLSRARRPLGTSSRSADDDEGGYEEEKMKEEEDEGEEAVEHIRTRLTSGAQHEGETPKKRAKDDLLPGLYVVATPIGNLADITLRALHVLKSSSLVCCEDTRTTRMMLKRYKIVGEEADRTRRVELMSYHQHSSPVKVDSIIQILKTGVHVVSLVSDAGTPSISDPGVPLISEAHKQNIPVFPIPGPSAVIAALSASGFPSERFIFEGFLPHERTKRKNLLKQLALQERTVAFYESPHRIQHTLADCVEVWGADQEAYFARELTKLHEQTLRGPLHRLRDEVQKVARGEFTVVIGPRSGRGDKRFGTRGPLDKRRLRDFSDVPADYAHEEDEDQRPPS